MSAKVRIADLPELDLAKRIPSDEDIATDRTLVIEEGDPSELTHGLGIVARARGVSEIASASGSPREALDKALRPQVQPRFDTAMRGLRGARRAPGGAGPAGLSAPSHQVAGARPGPGPMVCGQRWRRLGGTSAEGR
jgi:probable addiction module antidote protein